MQRMLSFSPVKPRSWFHHARLQLGPPRVSVIPSHPQSAATLRTQFRARLLACEAPVEASLEVLHEIVAVEDHQSGDPVPGILAPVRSPSLASPAESPGTKRLIYRGLPVGRPCFTSKRAASWIPIDLPLNVSMNPYEAMKGLMAIPTGRKTSCCNPSLVCLLLYPPQQYVYIHVLSMVMIRCPRMDKRGRFITRVP